MRAAPMKAQSTRTSVYTQNMNHSSFVLLLILRNIHCLLSYIQMRYIRQFEMKKGYVFAGKGNKGVQLTTFVVSLSDLAKSFSCHFRYCLIFSSFWWFQLELDEWRWSLIWWIYFFAIERLNDEMKTLIFQASL